MTNKYSFPTAAIGSCHTKLRMALSKLSTLKNFDSQRMSTSGNTHLNEIIDDIDLVSSTLEMHITLQNYADASHEDDFEDLVANMAFNITSYLVNAHYIKDCTDTNDMTEFHIQDNIRSIIRKNLQSK